MAAGVFRIVFLGILSIAAWQDKKTLSVSRKFLLLSGLWLGIWETLVILLFGMFLCSVFCGGLLLLRKAGRKTEVPFIPFLWVACLIGRILG